MATKTKSKVNLRPLGDRVIVQRAEAEEKSAGGILLVDSAKEKPKEGKIIAIGRKVTTPKGCQIIDTSNQHVYPGLMESMSNIGLSEINAVKSTVDTDEVGRENPNLRPWVAVNPDSEWIPVARAGGVLLAMLLGSPR